MYVCVDVYMIPRMFSKKIERMVEPQKKQSRVGWINRAQASSDQPSRVNDDRLHVFSFAIQELCSCIMLYHVASQ